MNKLKKEILKLHEQFPWFLPMFRIFHYKYYRGLYVNFLYRKYYKEAMEKYTECTTQFRNIEDLTVDIFRPGRDVNDFQFSQECITLIKKISKEVSEKIKYTENCYFFPPIDRSKAPEFVKDVSEVKEKKVLTAQLKEPLKIQLLNNLR